MNIVLLGYGVVGKGVFDMCASSEHFNVVKVLCKDPDQVPGDIGTDNPDTVLQNTAADTVVEVLGGLHPAWELVSAALKSGKNVVTANKFLVSHYYKEIMELGASGGVFRCTAAVGGGIPWLVNLERARRHDRITRVGGILNGTTNYILDTMHHSPVGFSEALASAQRLGYAEADPSADIDGLDIRRKLAISANVAFDAGLAEEEVLTRGIRTLQARDIAAFSAHGYTCKLLADAALHEDGSLHAIVEPCLVGTDWPEATVPANYNLISMEGEAVGRESFFGQGAGRRPTAYTVVQDLEDLQNGVSGFYTHLCRPVPVDNSQPARRYYVRTEAPDAWLSAHTERSWPEGGVLTAAVPPDRMYAAAEKLHTQDNGTFIAAVL